MITLEGKNTNKLAGIWLKCSLASHDFISPRYWEDNFANMRDSYLPASENFSYRDCPDGEIRGFISLNGHHIEALFVDPPFQGKGIGHKLLDFAKIRHPQLTLNVYSRNTRTVEFYKRNGFIETSRGIEPNTGEEEIYMEYRE